MTVENTTTRPFNWRIIAVATFALVIVAPTTWSANAQTTLNVNVFASGATDATANGAFLSGTIGQSFVGVVSASETGLGAGYWYALEEGRISTDIELVTAEASEFALRANYPNPFTRETTISFSLSEPSHATLRVYDLLGKEVGTPVDEMLPAGEYRATLSAAGLAAGTYVYRLETDRSSATGKMVIVR